MKVLAVLAAILWDALRHDHRQAVRNHRAMERQWAATQQAWGASDV